MPTFTIKIDQLPEEAIEAADAMDAARQVHALLSGHAALRKLGDEEPVQIKRPDGTPWGRHLTIGDFRAGLLDRIDDATAAGDGPQHVAKP